MRITQNITAEARLIELAVADAKPLSIQAVADLRGRILELKGQCDHCLDTLKRLTSGSFHQVLTAADKALEAQDLLVLMLQGGDPKPVDLSAGNFVLDDAVNLRRRLSLVKGALIILTRSLSEDSPLGCTEVQDRFKAMTDLLDL
jgi:hypothetical protein